MYNNACTSVHDNVSKEKKNSFKKTNVGNTGVHIHSTTARYPVSSCKVA